MTQVGLAFAMMISGFLVMALGYNFPRVRTLCMSIGFFILMSASFTNYSNWLPQARGEVPEVTKIEGDITSLSVEKLAEIGEKIIFGSEGMAKHGIGKGQCPLCHTFSAGQIGERAPNLIGIAGRANERILDDRYKNPDSIQTEAFSGSGRAATGLEYIAESHTCPSCFVVVGFGVKGSNDEESPMPTIHKAPINLTIDELVMVDTWLWFREGETPPSAADIRAAYEKFIPEGDPARASGGVEEEKALVGLDPAKLALPDDTPAEIVKKMVCFACHQIPTIPIARGVLGPLLVEGHNAPLRIASAEYKADIKSGKAKAKTPKEYVMESIMNPNAHVVPAFVNKANPGVSVMIQDFSKKFTFQALENMADFLLTLDCDAARADGLSGPAQENIDVVCGPSGKTAEGLTPDSSRVAELVEAPQRAPQRTP